MSGVSYFGQGGLILEPGGELVEDRYGLTSGQLRYRMPVGRHDLKPAYNSPHPLASFCLLERRRVVMTPGWWTLICDYAGSEQDESDPEYDLEIGTSREPVETHPRFVTHIGGKPSAPLNGAVFVDETGFPTSDDKLGVFDRFRMLKPNGERNPLAGMSAYEAANQTHWVKSWTSRTRPTDGGAVGKIDNPEGPNPSYDGRNWLYMGLQYRRRGGAYSIRKIWRLSGPGGWVEAVYGD